MMPQITLDDPEAYRVNVPVDDRGRVVVGQGLAGKRVTVVAEVSGDE